MTQSAALCQSGFQQGGALTLQVLHVSGAAAPDRAGILSCLVKARWFCSADQPPLNAHFPHDPGAAQDQKWIYQAVME